MKKFKNLKITNDKIENFLKDNINKTLIVSLLSLIIFFITYLFIKNIVLRFTIYFVSYFILNNLYLKVVNYLFRKDCK